ncbi:MAG TPA: hypothetical protein VGA64_01290 [Candidatus Polarisedimenticolia bacterium]
MINMTLARCGRSGLTKRVARGSLAAALVLAAASGRPLRAEIQLNPQGWKFPNIITAAKEIIRVSDRTALIPGKETLLKGYRKADGTHFMTYEIEGRVFGVQIDTDGKPPFEYSIMDTDGDGKFETKIVMDKSNKDQAYVPQWVVDYYYSKHPELKVPSAKVRVPSPAISVVAPPVDAPPPPALVVPPPDAIRRPSP